MDSIVQISHHPRYSDSLTDLLPYAEQRRLRDCWCSAAARDIMQEPRGFGLISLVAASVFSGSAIYLAEIESLVFYPYKN